MVLAQPAFRLVLVCVMFSVVGVGCESRQPSGEAKKEAPPPEPAKIEAPTTGAETALLAPTAAQGREENDEGVSHYEQGHWDVAEQHFRKALEVDPSLAEAHFNLALALDKQGKHEEATSSFKKAAELAPNNTNITASPILRKHTGT